MTHKKNICVLGGTGFVGRQIVEQLAINGHKIKILSRHRERRRELLVLPNVEIHTADVHDREVLKDHFSDQDVVINLVGILNEFGRNNFEKVHVELSRKVADTCLKKQVPRLLHMSALKANANTGTSKYLRSKGQAENNVHSTRDIQVTSFQPSVIFGPQDSFFNRFASLLAKTPPFLPFPLACASAKFAPIYVEDVAQVFLKSLDDKRTYGNHYTLCGPKNYTLLELVEFTSQITGLNRTILPLGNILSKLQASLLGLMPTKPFTLDNYRSTKIDSVCEQENSPIFELNLRSVESVVPLYLGKQSLHRRFSEIRRTSRRL